MAGDWIPWVKGLAKKPEVFAIAGATGMSRREVAATLMEFWEWADSETDDGRIPGLGLAQLPEVVVGTTESFFLAMTQVGWLQVEANAIVIPKFDRWLGRSAKRRIRNKEVQRSNRRPLSSSEDDNLMTDSRTKRASTERTTRVRSTNGNGHPSQTSHCEAKQGILPLLSSSQDDKMMTTEQNRTDRGMNSPITPSCQEPDKPASGPSAATDCSLDDHSTKTAPGLEAPAVGDRPVMVFPTVGSGPNEWPLLPSKLAEYCESYPGVDTLAECRKALQWCRDNPTRRKTFRGMAAFLTRWLANVQDRGSNGKAIPGTPRISSQPPALIDRIRQLRGEVS